MNEEYRKRAAAREKLEVMIKVVAVTLYISSMGVMAYIAAHFIRRFW